MRLFYAIDTPMEIKDKIKEVQIQLMDTNADVKWEPKEKFHITIKFLGDTDEKTFPHVENYLKELGDKFQAFIIKYKSLGCFPNYKQPRVVWVGTEVESDVIFKIKDFLDENLKRFGYKVEDRKFHPHITLGRIKSIRNIKNLISILENLKFETEPVKCGEIILMQSILKPTGSEYKVLRTVNLKG